MLAAFACVAGLALILTVGEMLWNRKILRGEYQRKFDHILIGSFVAFWPWIISFRTIQIISAFMIAVALFNHLHKTFHYGNNLGRHTYGDIFFALGIMLVSLLTGDKLFFALAILNMALADGLAAIAGRRYGKNWRYLVLTHTKTVIGSMTFWLVSLCIFGIGLLFSSDLAVHYLPLILFLPPALMLVENIPGLGADNVFVPLVVILVLNAIAGH